MVNGSLEAVAQIADTFVRAAGDSHGQHFGLKFRYLFGFGPAVLPQGGVDGQRGNCQRGQAQVKNLHPRPSSVRSSLPSRARRLA